MNVAQAKQDNLNHLKSIGGINGLLQIFNVDPARGLSKSQVEGYRERFGTNEFPETPLDSYFTLLLEALSDSTLLILIAAATVSLIIGVLTEENGWVEGAAIFIAIFLVSNISAGNDYTKQLQFKALEQSSAEDERTSVLREGFVERINPKELVVGDIVVLQVIHLFDCF